MKYTPTNFIASCWGERLKIDAIDKMKLDAFSSVKSSSVQVKSAVRASRSAYIQSEIFKVSQMCFTV